MPELLFLMYFGFSAYISANTMSVWHLVHRKSAFSHFNLLFPLFSQMFASCLPLSLKLSLKPELQFVVESLQLHETCRTWEPFTSPRSKLQPGSVWTAHEGRDLCVDPLGRRSALQVGAVELQLPRVEQGPGSGQMPSLALSPPEMLLSLVSNAC